MPKPCEPSLRRCEDLLAALLHLGHNTKPVITLASTSSANHVQSGQLGSSSSCFDGRGISPHRKSERQHTSSRVMPLRGVFGMERDQELWTPPSPSCGVKLCERSFSSKAKAQWPFSRLRRFLRLG